MTNELNDSKWGYGAEKMPPSPESPNQEAREQRNPESPTRLDTGRWAPSDFNVRSDTMQLGRIDIEDDSSKGSSRVDPNRSQHGLFPSNSDASDVGSEREEGSGDSTVDASSDHLDDDLDRSDSARNMIEWAVVLVASVLIALLIRAFFVQAFWIPSSSMESTLMINDRVLVNKIGYRVGDISRGDIVVFHKTEQEVEARPGEPEDVIKRVIALPGETILIENNQVLIDDQLLLEPYLDPGAETSDFGPSVVPENHLFVMGDNRNPGASADSRFELGPVSQDRVVGRAFFMFWPLNSLGGL